MISLKENNMDPDELRHQLNEQKNLQNQLEQQYGITPGPQADKLFELCRQYYFTTGRSINFWYDDLTTLCPDWLALKRDFMKMIEQMGERTSWQWIEEQLDTIFARYQ
jgi:hypothetical protein